ncbi:MAG: hypothetical protein QM664_09985 [Flavihumibacter sp.]
MKKLITTLTVLGLLVAFLPAQSQVRVGVQVNIGSQPTWGPAGYDYAEYYYMPDIDVYYNVPRRQFVYFDRGRWCFASSLPSAYRHFDLYSGYKVVVNEPNPYLRGNYFRDHYRSYRGWQGRQVVIRDAPRPRPAVVYHDRRNDRYDRRDSRRDDRYGRNDRHDRRPGRH